MNAHQWFKNGDHPLDYAEDMLGIEKGEPRTFSGEERRANGWEGAVVRYYRHPDPDFAGTRKCPHCERDLHDHGWIDCDGKGRVVCPGDWVITGSAGQHHPIKADAYDALVARALADEPGAYLWDIVLNDLKEKRALVDAAVAAVERLKKYCKENDREVQAHHTDEAGARLLLGPLGEQVSRLALRVERRPV